MRINISTLLFQNDFQNVLFFCVFTQPILQKRWSLDSILHNKYICSADNIVTQAMQMLAFNYSQLESE